MTDTRWSYKVVDFRAGFFRATITAQKMEEELNRLGAQGWELVSAETAQKPLQPVRAILKRPL